MNIDNRLVLPDGRTLAYAKFGKPDGFPVMYFHGAPSSRLEPSILGDDAWRDLGLRVVAPDRPGMGGSDFQLNRGFSDWPKDVVSLADSLGWQQFSVMGFSGGGAYAAVCAAKIPERLRAAVIVSGGWQMNLKDAQDLPITNRLVWILASRAPFMLPLLLKFMGKAPGTREQELAQAKKIFPAADYAALEPPGRLEAFGDVLRESLRQGTKGAAWDMRLYGCEFDFRLDEIRMPLKLFHGVQDANVPVGMVRRIAGELPKAELVTYEDDAHISTLCNHLDEFAAALIPKLQH
ncbi:MAG TPA: alpha/beta hydrolase [Pyrinomonadaceae bacterium]|jgi:pimeloyl-ACP methyl ester carboxylesterase|nr:alpha/beta hydrolase [Pyrinomonadaceae bacterium]